LPDAPGRARGFPGGDAPPLRGGALIYHISLLIEISYSYFLNYYHINYSGSSGDRGVQTDYFLYMNDNNQSDNINNPNPHDNIPRNFNNPDYPRIIRYISSNIAAMAIKRPFIRIGTILLTNGTNLFYDALSNEEKAPRWGTPCGERPWELIIG
jgi:hypothetical protein